MPQSEQFPSSHGHDSHCPSQSSSKEPPSRSPGSPRPSKRTRHRVRALPPTSHGSSAATAQPRSSVSSAAPSDKASNSASEDVDARSPSPPASTIWLQGEFLQPGDSQYEIARRVTGDAVPYWFSGGDVPGFDTLRMNESLQGVMEEDGEVVEIRLNDDDEQGKEKEREEA